MATSKDSGVDDSKDVKPWLEDSAALVIVPAGDSDVATVSLVRSTNEKKARSYAEAHVEEGRKSKIRDGILAIWDDKIAYDLASALKDPLSKNDTYTADMKKLGAATWPPCGTPSSWPHA